MEKPATWFPGSGFGAMRFADIDDEDRCAALVLRAYERGINYFDTAKGYFGGKSEERLGLAFKEMAITEIRKTVLCINKNHCPGSR
jgi:aryl-alcohol dehydrogenase-like predicted oxidoreductase